ncbi:MAG: preprotein translocase subunit SecE [bacterium]|jgi:preprotein translocase SecE subunit|nr:preprotein translocase subunit SecE [bacterium]
MAIKDTLDQPKRNKLLEVLSQDYRAENIFLALIAIVAMAFSVMILSGTLNVKDNYPLLGAYPKVFAIILLIISTLGLAVVLWPFYEPSLGEFKKITWAKAKEFYEDLFRVIVFMIFLVFILLFFDIVCRYFYNIIYS